MLCALGTEHTTLSALTRFVLFESLRQGLLVNAIARVSAVQFVLFIRVLVPDWNERTLVGELVSRESMIDTIFTDVCVHEKCLGYYGGHFSICRCGLCCC